MTPEQMRIEVKVLTDSMRDVLSGCSSPSADTLKRLLMTQAPKGMLPCLRLYHAWSIAE